MITVGKYTGGKVVALQGGDRILSMVIASIELGRTAVRRSLDWCIW